MHPVPRLLFIETNVSKTEETMNIYDETEVEAPFALNQELLVIGGDRWVKAFYSRPVGHPNGNIHEVKVETQVGRLPIKVSFASIRTLEDAERDGIKENDLVG